MPGTLGPTGGRDNAGANADDVSETHALGKLRTGVREDPGVPSPTLPPLARGKRPWGFPVPAPQSGVNLQFHVCRHARFPSARRNEDSVFARGPRALRKRARLRVLGPMQRGPVSRGGCDPPGETQGGTAQAVGRRPLYFQREMGVVKSSGSLV